jgi:hypothetical protein
VEVVKAADATVVADVVVAMVADVTADAADATAEKAVKVVKIKAAIRKLPTKNESSKFVG